MLEIIERLLILQEKDQRIQSLTSELARVPIEIEALEAEIETLTKNLESSRKDAHQNELDRKKLQAEVKTKMEGITRLRQQQLQTKKNEEYAALNKEIAHTENIIRELEDRELELMEAFEPLKQQLVESDAHYAKNKAHLQERIKGVQQKKEQIESRLKTFQDEREKLVENIDEDSLDQYERLFKNKEGIALAALENGVCQGCHMHSTTQTIVDVKAERETTFCPQCGRFLYFSV